MGSWLNPLDLQIQLKLVPRRTLPEFLRQHREAVGLSQTDLANRLGVKQQLVSKWEAGTGIPTIARIPALAAALDVDAGELLQLVAEASQAETATIKRDRNQLLSVMDRVTLFTEKYEELGHTYRSNHDLLEQLVEQFNAIVEMGRVYREQVDSMLDKLEEQGSRIEALERRQEPGAGTPPAKRGRYQAGG